VKRTKGDYYRPPTRRKYTKYRFRRRSTSKVGRITRKVRKTIYKNMFLRKVAKLSELKYFAFNNPTTIHKTNNAARNAIINLAYEMANTNWE